MFCGCYNKKSHSENCGVNISQTSKNSKYLEEIEDILKQLPFNYLKTFLPDLKNKIEGIKGFNINSVVLGRELLKYGEGSYNKSVPQYVKECTPRQISLFLDAYLKGDGYFTWGGAWTMRTKSYQLALDLKELFLKANIYASLKKETTPIKKKWIIDHWARVGGTNYSLQTYHNNYSHWLTKENFKEESYSGCIYNVETDSPTHSIYIMRNGKSFWASDSVASLVPQYELDESMEKQTIGLHARYLDYLY